MNDEPEFLLPTFLYHIPFLLLGIAIGMATVWVALQWVPTALANALVP